MRTVQAFTAFVLFLFLFANKPANAQVQFKLQWLPDSTAWGVFARPEPGVKIPKFTIIGSGQVTIVTPPGSRFFDLRSFSGTWEQNAYVATPKENPNGDYISFGMMTADPPIVLQDGEETLLFTFKAKEGQYPEWMYLMPDDDPFNQLPNSQNSNPGNDITALDPGTAIIYSFTGIYNPDAWDWRPENLVPQGPYRQGLDKRHPRIYIKP